MLDYTLLEKSSHTGNDNNTSRLFQQTINLIFVFELEHLGCLVCLDALPIQHETQAVRRYTATSRVRFKDLGHFRRLFHLEEGFFASLCVCGRERKPSEKKNHFPHVKEPNPTSTTTTSVIAVAKPA